jgi:hypothetical protein
MNKRELEIKARILRKLARTNKWGENHTSFDNIQKSFPKHLMGEARDTGRKLIKECYLLSKPTNYGLEISLNPAKSEEIIKTIRDFFGEKTGQT